MGDAGLPQVRLDRILRRQPARKEDVTSVLYLRQNFCSQVGEVQRHHSGYHIGQRGTPIVQVGGDQMQVTDGCVWLRDTV